MMLVAEGLWADILVGLIALFFALIAFGLPALGYVFMFIDFQAYLRSLKRAMVLVRSRFQGRPAWAYAETPAAIKALGLSMPCTEADVLSAYRRRVKKLHPDRGGDRQQFLRFQAHFEEAIKYVRHRKRDRANPT